MLNPAVIVHGTTRTIPICFMQRSLCQPCRFQVRKVVAKPQYLRATTLCSRSLSTRTPSVAAAASGGGDYYTRLTLDLIEQLKQQLSKKTEFTQNPYELRRHGLGESYHAAVPPELVVSPATVEDVQVVTRFCNEHRIPLIPFGAGTSLEGHVAALHGGISLDMAQFQGIELPTEDDSNEIPDPIAVVGAGVTRKTLNAALKQTGLQFSVDPGADATLGGMAATGASGTTAVHHGTMRENTLALQCVLADGTLVQTGTRALKNSAGYDLKSLFLGSEGTLGVITSLTVKLHPVSEWKATAIAVFDDLRAAATAVAALKLYDVPVLRCELLDAASVQAFNSYSNQNMQVKPTLFLELQAFSEVALEDQIRAVKTLCHEDYQAAAFEASRDVDRSAQLWAARHKLYYAAIAARPGAVRAIVTDACVPLSQFPAVLEATAADVAATGVVGPCFGHAGDGNLHCILPVCEGDDLGPLLGVQERLMQRTLKARGTVTGEHGVGYGKIPLLQRQYGDGAITVMRLVKQALDPSNIMNPDKIVPCWNRSIDH